VGRTLDEMQLVRALMGRFGYQGTPWVSAHERMNSHSCGHFTLSAHANTHPHTQLSVPCMRSLLMGPNSW
jgi:hypothetical protein